MERGGDGVTTGGNMIREVIIRGKIETSHGFREGAKFLIYRRVDILSSQAKGTISTSLIRT